MFVDGFKETLNVEMETVKAEFNLSLQALGQTVSLMFSAKDVIGKAVLGGKFKNIFYQHFLPHNDYTEYLRKTKVGNKSSVCQRDHWGDRRGHLARTPRF